MSTRVSRVKSVSRLLFKDRPDSVNRTPCQNSQMVRRVSKPRITVGSATIQPALGDTKISVKKNQAWRYPGGVIQRHAMMTINGKRYYDDKDPSLPRRKQESNFFITLNSNRACDGGELASSGKQCMKQALQNLAKDEYLRQYIKFGPKTPEVYKNDCYDDVIQKIDWTAAVELGDQMQRLHCHIWLTVHHYSQVQINCPVLQHLFKEEYNSIVNETLSGGLAQGLVINNNPYIQVKLLPSSDWSEVMKQYIHKGMMASNVN